MANQIVHQDHLLAKKYNLGVPTRKFNFNSRRYSLPRMVLLFAELLLIALSGLFCIASGCILLISTTFTYNLFTTWLWLSLVSAVPIAFGWIMYRQGNRRLFMLNIMSCILSLLLVTAVDYWFNTHPAHLDPIAYLFGGLCLIVTGSLMSFLSLYFLPLLRSVLICTDGCLFMQTLQPHKVVRWEQIASFRLGKGFARIICSDGTSMKLRRTWAHSSTVQHLIYGKAFRHLFARARSSYNSGESVGFGRFTVTWQGIHNGRQLFPWDQLRSCVYVDSGVALISVEDTCLDLAYLSQLPDATIFVELIKYVLGTRRTGSQHSVIR
ncbi:hypothetical protein KDA_12320 [Dictyobacter alpinus]|uniref:Uncharacterized protein n=1 Tax=Dictyobacter alpinus TaxID=2014873 RepID=A0A402B337_9CHLR|nr:DUF6585 family protein [Dictyobacter alpinus]GCE25748.1 hypothetical protein KDA_12320 [Dictyobacter alpinus]